MYDFKKKKKKNVSLFYSLEIPRFLSSPRDIETCNQFDSENEIK